MTWGSFATDDTSAENLLELVQAFIKSGGIEEFHEEARLILETVLESDYTSIRAGLVPKPTLEQIETAFRLATRRISGAPIAHVLGFTYFYGRCFRLAPGVLVPRPETEILVDAAIGLLRDSGWDDPWVLDLYSGCGNILLSIAASEGIGRGVGIERDPVPLEFGEINRRAFGCENVEFRCGDVSQELDKLERRFHLVTANPPYVATGDIPKLQPEVSHHEKWTALDGGPDGLRHLRVLAGKAPQVIVPGGRLLSEIGMGQSDAIERIFSQWSSIEFKSDLNGIPRVLLAEP